MSIDLILVVALTLVLQPLVYLVSLEPVRIVLGLLLVLLFPGYALLSALYPKREGLDGVERVALGLGLSLALVPLVGLALHFSPWEIRLTPVVLTLSLWTLALSAIAWLQRRRVAPEERFDVSWAPVAAWLRRTRRPMDLALGLSLVLCVVVLVGAVAWRLQHPAQGEPFTEFYVLGAEHTLQDYPTTLRVGEAQDYNTGVTNHERGTLTYSIVAFLDHTQVGALGPLILENEETWTGKIDITPTTAGERQKLELRLYRDATGKVYRTVHLFVDVLGE